MINVNDLLWIIKLQQLENTINTFGENNDSGDTSFASLFSDALGKLDQLSPYSGANYITEPASYSDHSFSATDTGNNQPNDNTSLEVIINKAASQYNLDPNLIKSVIKAESNFNINAQSSAGAQGLMQLMPATAKEMGINNAFDPVQNIFGGAKYLRKMMDTFDNNRVLAVAAYNAGPGNVKKYGGIPPYKETQNYVKKVLGKSIDTLA